MAELKTVEQKARELCIFSIQFIFDEETGSWVFRSRHGRQGSFTGGGSKSLKDALEQAAEALLYSLEECGSRRDN